MNSPTLYRRANKLQRDEAKKVIKEFADVLQPRSDGKDSLMDVGCGTGDVLVDFIIPILPQTYSKVVGTDISPRMVQYSKEAFAERDRVTFNVLDIGTNKMPLEYYEQFDHVTSFICLHWVQNQRQALKNIYDMLLKGGDCLLVFIVYSPAFDVFQLLATDPKWNEYMKDVDRFIPSSQSNTDPWLTYMKLFKEVGFAYPRIEIRQTPVVHEGYERFRDHVVSVCPFIERIPPNKREEYIEEMCDHWKRNYIFKEMTNKGDPRYTYVYKTVVAYAKK